MAHLNEFGELENAVATAPPPSAFRSSINNEVMRVLGEADPTKTVTLIGIPTTAGVNLAIAVRKQTERYGEWEIAGYVGKTWGRPIEGGSYVKWSK